MNPTTQTSYEAWRISYQSSEQAARAAWEALKEAEEDRRYLQIVADQLQAQVAEYKWPRVEGW